MRDLGSLADLVGAIVTGDRGLPIRGLAPLEAAGPDQISFLANPRYRPQLASSRAGAVLAPAGTTVPSGTALLTHDDPYGAFAVLMGLFYPEPVPSPGVHTAAWVDPGAEVDGTATVGPGAAVLAGAVLGAGVVVDANAVIGEEVVVGPDSRIGAAAVVIAGTRVGARCRIGPGSVIGSPGFGYAPTADGWQSIPQVGVVVLEDEVDVGAGCTVDRATLGETRVGRGSKLDNQVQLGHNVVIGAGSVIVAQSGIAGSTRVGEGVQLGGQVGLVGHLTIGDGARVGAGSGVRGDVPAGATVSGAPAFDHGGWRRSVTAFPRLPDLLKRVRTLERELAELKQNMKNGGEEGSNR
ncbi:MAG: UDP-3-O-(3-hydroxymyristoyl)glucosamine N-acyltransferase [Myxococcota bacterium]|nr:UDP-3-O-(3-hydroxymyristoyl)glucosamine N-acyltransferase [Myxococcota bacterium]